MTLYFCNSVVVSAHTYCFPSVHSSKPLQRHWSKQALKIVVWHNSFSIILLFQLDASFFKTKHFTDMLDDQKRQGVQAKCKRSRWDHWREGCPGDVAVPSTARTLSAMLILYIHACLPSWFKHPPLRNYLLDCEFSWPIHRSRCSQFFLSHICSHKHALQESTLLKQWGSIPLWVGIKWLVRVAPQNLIIPASAWTALMTRGSRQKITPSVNFFSLFWRS